MRRPGRLLWLAVPVVALLAAHAALWRWAVQRLDEGFASWAADRRAAGWTVRAGAAERGGWPLAARLTIPGVAVAGGDADIPGGFAWQGERVALTVSLWRPGVLDVESAGAQSVRLGAWAAIPYTADTAHLTIPLQGPSPSRQVSVLATNLRAALPGIRGAAGTAATGGAGVTVGLLNARFDGRPMASSAEAALAFTVAAEAITLLPGVAWAFGDHISSVVVQGALSGPVPRARVLATRAETWRDGGGTLGIQHFALGWGPLGLSGTATLSLDPALQPMGTGTARIVGYAEALAALGSAGVLNRRAVATATAIAALVASTPEGGGPPEVELPLTLQDRTLSARQIPFARMPELTWPDQ